jgi:hypothetical protein
MLWLPTAVLLFTSRLDGVLAGLHPVWGVLLLTFESAIKATGLVYGPISRMFDVEAGHYANGFLLLAVARAIGLFRGWAVLLAERVAA